MKPVRTVLVLFVVLAAAPGIVPALSATPIPVDGIDALGVALESHPDGGSLVAWTGPGPVTGLGRVMALRLAEDGSPGSVVLADPEARLGSVSALAVAAGGDWLVIGPDGLAGSGGSGALAGFVLSPDGALRGELDLAVPEATAYRSPVAAALPDGGWAVAWAVSTPSDFGDQPPQPMFPYYDAYVAVYDEDGGRTAGPVRVNVERSFDQDPADLLAGPETIVVAWFGYTGEVRLDEGTGRILGHDLALRTGEIQLNPERTDDASQRYFHLVSAPAGGFVAAWTALEGELDGTDHGVFSAAVRFQRFAADCSKVGPDRLANVRTAGVQQLVSAAVTGDGTVWLLWVDLGPGDEPQAEPRLVARPFTLDGFPLGSEIEIASGDAHFEAEIAGGVSAPVVLWRSGERWLAEVIGGDRPQEAPEDERALASPDLPGFRVWVRFSAPGVSIWGREEALCIPETLCASGALPGRTEVLVRVVGPKPNGFLWPTLVKLSTSEVEVWIEQLSTGDVQFYLLPGASPGNDVLDGLFDRRGFSAVEEARRGNSPPGRPVLAHRIAFCSAIR